jgi:uncharacterized membrane protein YuzA (DUF378 family)
MNNFVDIVNFIVGTIPPPYDFITYIIAGILGLYIFKLIFGMFFWFFKIGDKL